MRGGGDGESDGGAKVIEMTSEQRAGRRRGKTRARARTESVHVRWAGTRRY